MKRNGDGPPRPLACRSATVKVIPSVHRGIARGVNVSLEDDVVSASAGYLLKFRVRQFFYSGVGVG